MSGSEGIGIALVVILVAFLFTLVVTTIIRVAVGWFGSRPSKSVKLEKEPDQDRRFCTDCGNRFVQWRFQTGFSRATGERNMQTLWACPDQRPNMLQHSLECGVPVPDLLPHLASCTHGATADMECTSCVANMVFNGMMTVAQGNLVLSGTLTAMEVLSGVDPPPDPMATQLTGSAWVPFGPVPRRPDPAKRI